MTYRQVRGRAASLSPKSRPKIPLPAQSALCLPRNLLTTAHTVRKMHKFLNGRCVPYDGQDGAAIGCSVSASIFSHRAMRHRRAACLALLRTVSAPNSAGLYCRFLKTFRFAISRGAGLHFGEGGRLPLAQAPAAPRAHESCAVRRQKRARHIKVRPPGTLRPCGAVRAAVCACWARATCLRRGMPARAAPRARRVHAGGLSPRRCCAKHVEGGPPGGLAAAHR